MVSCADMFIEIKVFENVGGVDENFICIRRDSFTERIRK
jgi:hypothetical protein